MTLGETGLDSRARLLEPSLRVLDAAFLPDADCCRAKDEGQVDSKMAGDDEDGDVTDLELEDGVIVPGRVYQNRVHRGHQNQFVKELESALGLLSEDVCAD